MFQPNMFEPHHHHMFDLPIHKINNDSDFSKLIMDDEFEAKPGFDHIMDISSGDDLYPTQRPRKKRFRRHTQRQIQEMEAFFKECPYPDDKQRKELSRELGLELLQVKFWFQNKRTQIKAQHERHENSMLKAENEKLRAEVARNAEALSVTPCPKCGGPAGPGEMSCDEQQLRIEIARLKEEVDRLSGIAAKYVGKSLLSNTNISPYNNNVPKPHASRFGTQQSMVGVGVGEMYGTCHEVLRSDKPMIVELALSAMEELLMVAQASSPLWVPGENSGETLNEEEYLRTFSRGIEPKPLGFKTEASRESIVVVADHMNLVEYLMDVDQWSNVFCGIVSKAATIEVLSSGVGGNFNGALQVMKAEFQVPSPLVPVRENYMVRYCKQHGEGVWAVVDVSLDSSRPNLVVRGKRRPSGCLIQELANGYSKVTWVEHVEVGDKAVNPIYRPLVSSGLAFGAKRWVSTLERQCERLASLMATHIPAGGPCVITSSEGRKSMMRLAERMVLSFCGGVGASTTHAWTTLSATGSDNVRVMTRKSMDEPGGPLGIVLSATTSLWLPVPPKQVFDFLRNEKSRSEWDILSNGGIVQEMAHIANGRVPGNSVSLLRVNSTNSSQSNMLILQESCSDSTGSYVIYAPVDNGAMNLVLTGGDPDQVALLPSGFAILPDGPGSGAATAVGGGGILEVGSGGSLLTVSFQILVDSVPTAKLSLGSVATVNSLIKCTIKRIKAAVLRGGAASKNKKMRHNM